MTMSKTKLKTTHKTHRDMPLAFTTKLVAPNAKTTKRTQFSLPLSLRGLSRLVVNPSNQRSRGGGAKGWGLLKGRTPKNKDVKYDKTNPISCVFKSKMRGEIKKARPGFEPGDKGFADLCLTTWLSRLKKSGKRDSNSRRLPWQGSALPTELFPPVICC